MSGMKRVKQCDADGMKQEVNSRGRVMHIEKSDCDL